MNSSLEVLEGNRVKLSVTIDEAEFDRDIDQAFRKIAREVRLPGFRAGKAPRRVLEARIGVAPAREQALRDAIPNYLRRAVREHAVDLIATPEVEITGGAEAGPVGFDATCEVRPEVTVPGYGGLRVELPNPSATDDEIAEAVTAELKRHGGLTDVERPAARGDFVTVDLAVTRDGEAVAGLNTDDWSYELGAGWVAEEFDDHLVGASPGDTKEFSAVPKGTTEPADFRVAVTRVQELVPPELTDEWVAENFDELDSVDAWRQAIADRIGAAKLEQARQLIVGRTTEALAGLTEVDPPESMVSAEMRRRAEGTARQLAAQGVDLAQFLGATGQDPGAFIEGFRPQAEQGARVDLALRAVASAEGLVATDDDVEDEYRHLALHLGQKPNQVRKAYEANDAVVELKAQIRKTKALDWLLEHVEVVDEAGVPLDRAPLLAGRHHDHADRDDHDDHHGEDHDQAGAVHHDAVHHDADHTDADHTDADHHDEPSPEPPA